MYGFVIFLKIPFDFNYVGKMCEATTYAESCGGGGSPGSGWGRDKDDDDDHWWRRCITVSAAMMRPAKYRMRRGRKIMSPNVQ